MKFNFLRRSATILLVSVFVFLQSCSSDSESVKIGASGFFVLNEGNFNSGSTEVSFFDRKTNLVSNNVFQTKNGRVLGDQSQSLEIFENKGFIVVQNSSKVEVVNIDDFSSFASITALISPRYFIGINSKKGYVTDWGRFGIEGTVKVVDLTTYEVIKTIPTGKGANRMLKVNNLVYVTNSGGYDRDNTVKIIDTTTDTVIGSITVGDNPNSIQRDKDGNIWVASSGYTAYKPDYSTDEANSTKGSISKISSANVETARLSVSTFSYSGPANLAIASDGTTLYYTFDNAIYSISTAATTLPSAAFAKKNYYGVAVDPFNGNIIGCNAPNFSSAGSIDVMDTKGVVLNSYSVGIGPNGCTFK